MSIELRAEVLRAGDARAAMIEALEKDREFQMLPSSVPGVVKLRFANNPLREHWPEDVELHFLASQIVAVFHSASRKDRERLVDLLEAALAKAGFSGKFTED